MNHPTLSDLEFRKFQSMIYDIAGISMSAAKKPLVSGRLSKRVKQRGLDSYGEYFRLITESGEASELQMAVDLLTTNETYFFREPRHFDFLRQQVLPQVSSGQPFRVWSAACSSGEEPYSIAMMLAGELGEAPWEIVASDLSTRVLERARGGLYALERAKHIPHRYLTAHCLKGTGEYEGMFLVNRRLRERVRFMQVNLNAALPEVGKFDVIFLRNVMIYFDNDTKRQVVDRLINQLHPGGYFIVGHSESLNGLTERLVSVQPTIYRLP